jgi:hypothetical protein
MNEATICHMLAIRKCDEKLFFGIVTFAEYCDSVICKLIVEMNSISTVRTVGRAGSDF